jgi:hypothetical protein
MPCNILEPVIQAFIEEDLAHRAKLRLEQQQQLELASRTPEPAELVNAPPEPTHPEPQQELPEPVVADPEPPSDPGRALTIPSSRAPRRRPKPRKRAHPKPLLNYHAAQCPICNHPEREAIEQGFLHWRRVSHLAHEFKLGHRSIVYRHAHALGLFERRAARMRHALGYIIEQAENTTPTADGIIRAIRAYSCLDDNGRWTDPPKRLIISTEPRFPLPAGSSIERADEFRSERANESVATPVEQKTDLNPCKSLTS